MDPSPLDKTTLATLSLLEARLLRVEHLLYGATPAPREPPTVSGADAGGRPAQARPQSAAASLAELERRFATLLGRVRVYAELLKIYKAYPSLFRPPPSEPVSPPPSLAAQRATVLAMASTIAGVSSGLSGIGFADSVVAHPSSSSPNGGVVTAPGGAPTPDRDPIPDARRSAELASLAPRLAAAALLQRAQEAEMAALRARSEVVVGQWYRGGWRGDAGAGDGEGGEGKEQGRGPWGVIGLGEYVAEVEARVERAERKVRRAERLKDEEGTW